MRNEFISRNITINKDDYKDESKKEFLDQIERMNIELDKQSFVEE